MQLSSDSSPTLPEDNLRPASLSQGGTADLTHCDREPIHIPSRIQPHGVLLALSEPKLTIVQASDNTELVFGVSAQNLIGSPLEELLAPPEIAALHASRTQADLDANTLYLFTTHFAPALTTPENGPPGTLRTQAAFPVENAPGWDAILHRAQGILVLEFELARPRSFAGDDYALVRRAIPPIQNAPTLQTMLQAAAGQAQRLSGFDRVMIYQFGPDGHGRVVAEAKREALTPFLGLHFPASDIPQQARRLYVLNLIRLIADVNYAPVDLVPPRNPITNAPLDMSHSTLRSVSPIHIQYLKNMGVGASMSVSIVQNGELWGLIACHHETPRYVPYNIRTACEFLGQVVALQIAAKQEAENQALVIRQKETLTRLIEAMTASETYQEGLTGREPNLRDYIASSGAVVCAAGKFLRVGDAPEDAFLARLVHWLADRPDDDVFAIDALPSLFPEAEAIRETASGLVAVPISRQQKHYLLWFRPEVVQTVEWAGDPTKPVERGLDVSESLRPRASFAAWSETVRGTSRPWLAVEIEAARDLRRAIGSVLIRKSEEIARRNALLERSNEELDAFTYIASHDLKEPLRGIQHLAQFLQEDFGDGLPPEGQAHFDSMTRLTGRMESLIDVLLQYSQVGRQELNLRPVDLNAVVEETLFVLSSRLKEAGTQVRVPRPLPTVVCDEFQVSEIFLNLMTNAVKYNDKPEKWVEVGYLLSEALSPIFYVRDNGIGIREKHQEMIFGLFKRLHAREALWRRKRRGPDDSAADGGATWRQTLGRGDMGRRHDVLFYAWKQPGSRRKRGPPVTPETLLTRTVLIVDDNAADRQVAIRYLRRDRDHAYTFLGNGNGRSEH